MNFMHIKFGKECHQFQVKKRHCNQFPTKTLAISIVLIQVQLTIKSIILFTAGFDDYDSVDMKKI